MLALGDRPTRAVARPEPAVGLGTIVVLGGLTSFASLSLDMYLPALPLLSRQLHGSAPAAQLTLTACLIGLGAGQLVAGPVSDAFGRRRPLLVGLSLYVAASLLCARADSIWALVVLRLVQGAAGAAGIVVARAIVRDLRSGPAAARMFATLMLVNGLSPIVAPVFGGQLLRLGSWRDVFLALAAVGALLLAASWLRLPETLPPGRRRRGGLGASVRVFGRLLGDAPFVGQTLAYGLALGAMFAYIAGSPFVLQSLYGLSPQAFSVVFAVNAAGIVATSQVSRQLVGRLGPRRLLTVGLVACACGGLALPAGWLLGGGLVWMLAALWVVVASVGLVSPNATALALAEHPDVTGSASALIGLAPYAIGGAVAPLVGLAGAATPWPMDGVIAALATAALLAPGTAAALGRRWRAADGRPVSG